MGSWRRQQVDRDLASACESINGPVLEIGAGHLKRRGLFRPPVYLRWLTLDVDPTVRPDICGDGELLPVASQSMQAVMCAEVLQETMTPAVLLSEMYRVLRPGGRLVLSLPRDTRISARELVESVGFTVRSLRAQGGGWLVIADLLQKVRRPGRWHPLRLVEGLCVWSDRRWPSPKWTGGHLVIAERM